MARRPPSKAARSAGAHRPKKRCSSKPKRARNNPDKEEKAAGKLSAKFHGRKPRKITDITTERVERYALAELGRLIELAVILPSGRSVLLEFTGRRPRVASSPEGGQLYFEGGDQALDLQKLGLSKQLPKDHLEIGAVHKIVYHTSKKFHDFEPGDYVHEFAEEGGQLPTLAYDALNKRLFLIGGTYQTRPEGIRN